MDAIKADQKLYQVVGKGKVKHVRQLAAQATTAGRGKALLEAIDRAVKEPYPAIVFLLLQHEISTGSYELALKIATRRHWPDVIVNLLQLGASSDGAAAVQEKLSQLAREAENTSQRLENDRALLKLLESGSNNIFAPAAKILAAGTTQAGRDRAIESAARRGYPNTSEALLAAGVSLPARDRALVEVVKTTKAASNGHILRIARAILGAGTSTAARDAAVTIAAKRSFPNTTAALLAAGVSLEARSAALIEAVAGESENVREVVGHILTDDTSLEARDAAYKTAKRRSFPNTTRMILKAGISVEARSEALVELITATPHDMLESVAEMLEGETSLKSRDDALKIAARRSYPHTCALLLAAGTSLEGRNLALLEAVSGEGGHVRDIVEAILQRDTAIEARDWALRVARQRGFDNTSQALIKAGASLEPRPQMPERPVAPPPPKRPPPGYR